MLSVPIVSVRLITRDEPHFISLLCHTGRVSKRRIGVTVSCLYLLSFHRKCTDSSSVFGLELQPPIYSCPCIHLSNTSCAICNKVLTGALGWPLAWMKIQYGRQGLASIFEPFQRRFVRASPVLILKDSNGIVMPATRTIQYFDTYNQSLSNAHMRVRGGSSIAEAEWWAR